jgi:VCBS repeat-containing protein
VPESAATEGLVLAKPAPVPVAAPTLPLTASEPVPVVKPMPTSLVVAPAARPPVQAATPGSAAAVRRPTPGLIGGLLAGSELGGGGPSAPLLPSPADVIAVAFVRRETMSAAAASAAGRQQLSAQAVGGSTFSNRSPTLNPRQTGQSAGGVVSGNLNAVDPDNATLTFTVTARPTHGTVTVRTDGSYSYTADPALAATGTTDSFGVTVSDAAGGFHVHGAAGLLNLLSGGRRGSSGHTASATVPVVVAPFGSANRAPTGTVVVGSPNGVTGVVTGSVSGSDADGDRLTYSAPASTAKGSVGISSAVGSFTFTPTAAARHIAALLTATAGQRTETFTVTVSDGRGGTAAVPVTVGIAGANVAPVGRVPTVGVPDAGTGRVTGSVSATDADGDTLTYSAPASTAKGSLGINSTAGSFTYTPTTAARQTAAGAGATAADLRDSFTVTVTDAHGGTANVAVTVPVSPSALPANRAPTGTAVVGSPNGVTGVVTGSVSGSDADGDRLTYSAPASTGKGAVVINSAVGSFTFTPTAAARHIAALLTATAGQRTETFTVTVSDGRGGTAAVPVSVGIAGANVAPVTGVPTVGVPDAGTGRVNGSVSATDADGDVLTYSAPTSTAKGSIGISSTAGSFTYTPTMAARQTAAGTGATAADRRDSFTVTVTDAHGGTANVAVTVPVSPASIPAGPLAAFPGAEGFGAYATGGRGGSVVYVTNLNANGPGSLQWAIDQPGAKYVLFKVSGVIDTQIHLTNGNVTIAGQTSPGGITIRGLVTDETPYQDQAVQPPADFAENWILQHIRIRPGLDGPSDDGLRIRYTRNAIVDHVSIGNATDEAIEISYSHDITVQNTLIAETLGGHSFYGGILMNYSNPANGFGLDNVSLHHNVFNRIEGRLPEGSRESGAAANSYMNLELSNNLYWDPRFFIALGVDTAVAGGQPIYWRLNAVNNFFRTANGFQFGMFDDQLLNVARNELFVSGNKMSLYPTRSDYQLFYCCNDYPAESSPDATSRRAQARTSRHPFPAITYTPTDQLRTVLLNTAGAWPRDPMDIRLMGNVASNTIASAAPNVNPANDALRPAYTGSAPAAPVDTDNDGMPDNWETVKGLNPAVANTNAHTLSSAGYTDLDVYLNELSTSRVTGWAG